MSQEKREIVIPSQLLGDTRDQKAGRGTFIENGKIYSERLGILSKRGEYINTVPLKGRYDPIEDDFGDLTEFESKTPEEQWQEINDTLSVCTRCYACREACPMCYCNLCFVDQNKPIWFGKTTDMSDIVVFHLVRAMHMAGRCVACGACSSACPMGIDLNKITRKLEKIVKERYDFTSGIDAEKLPPMMDFELEEAEEFMLEED